ncbi:hypothetical protein [Hyphomicrobium sp. CS1BSMeth3]|uniref:hypothetical protein n=1 Tax=Hyphomicrobium sp. CS1BSMeth3 TaxID=1892844 RepID=UPI000931BB42|nr:hypothetical protein [Hyphomicrobium sp. CS1BSMeth3]
MTEVLAALADLPIAQLAVRMVSVAVFIVLVSLISERVGPFFGAMVASLPVYTGPVYLFLALDHPPEFLARAAVASVAALGVTPIYLLIYGLFARAGHSMPLSLLAGLAAWIVCAVLIQFHDWSLIEALLFGVPIFAVATLLAPRFTDAIPLKAGERRWSDLVVRVLLVTIVVGIVNALSPFLPTQLTGILSIMPTITTSLIVVLHGRIGGPATAALLAHSIGGLIGMFSAVALVAATVAVWGPALSLSLALAVCVAWNLMLIAAKQGRALFKRRSR